MPNWRTSLPQVMGKLFFCWRCSTRVTEKICSWDFEMSISWVDWKFISGPYFYFKVFTGIVNLENTDKWDVIATRFKSPFILVQSQIKQFWRPGKPLKLVYLGRVTFCPCKKLKLRQEGLRRTREVPCFWGGEVQSLFTQTEVLRLCSP